MPRLTLRIDFDDARAIGPGKIRLLELIDALNRCFREPLVASHAGGARGGGASLTPAGCAVVRHYRAVEAAAHAAAAAHLEALAEALAASAASSAEGRHPGSGAD